MAELTTPSAVSNFLCVLPFNRVYASLSQFMIASQKPHAGDTLEALANED